MANRLFLQDIPIYTLSTSNVASLANLSGTTAVGNVIDNRSSGATTAAVAMFSLTCQWNGVTTGITTGTDIADLYLLPEIDGSTLPQFDVTAGASQFPANAYVGSFIQAASTVTVSTATLYNSPIVELFPTLYTAAIKNQSGQTMASSWILKVAPAVGSYT